MRSEEWWWKRRGAAFHFMAMAGFVQTKGFLPAAGQTIAAQLPRTLAAESAAERIPREPLRGCSE